MGVSFSSNLSSTSDQEPLIFQGEDLIETSSQLIHQGEAIRVTSGMWTNNIVLFLFDHQLIYCKKVCYHYIYILVAKLRLRCLKDLSFNVRGYGFLYFV